MFIILNIVSNTIIREFDLVDNLYVFLLSIFFIFALFGEDMKNKKLYHSIIVFGITILIFYLIVILNDREWGSTIFGILLIKVILLINSIHTLFQRKKN